MHWIAPSERDAANDALEKQLWAAANKLWAGAGLKQSEYSEPVLGLIFLRFAENRFSKRRAELEKSTGSSRRGSQVDESTAYHSKAILYLPAVARYEHLLNLPEGSDIGQAVNDAMRAIERDNPHMAGVLPKSYQIFDSRLLAEILKILSSILRLRRHVRAECAVRQRASEKSGKRAIHPRPGARGCHCAAGADEPCGAWPGGRNQAGQRLLRRPPRRGWPLRLSPR